MPAIFGISCEVRLPVGSPALLTFRPPCPIRLRPAPSEAPPWVGGLVQLLHPTEKRGAASWKPVALHTHTQTPPCLLLLFGRGATSRGRLTPLEPWEPWPAHPPTDIEATPACINLPCRLGAPDPLSLPSADPFAEPHPSPPDYPVHSSLLRPWAPRRDHPYLPMGGCPLQPNFSKHR
jgi:hypothetical protein